MGNSCLRRTACLIIAAFAMNQATPALAASSVDSLLESRSGGRGAEFFVGQDAGVSIKVTVIGGVRGQGVYHIPESTDLVSLLGYGGGATEGAKLDDITIKRRKGDAYELIDVSLKDIITSKDKTTPRLTNGDVVFVPESRATQNLTLGLTIVSTILSIILAGYAVSKIK